MGSNEYENFGNEEMESTSDGSVINTFNQVKYDGTTSSKKMDIKKFKFKVWKNIIVLAVSFLLLFTAYHPVQNLQSSINKKLGIVGMWVIYTSALISNMFVPSIVIGYLGSKWTVSISMLCYSTYIAAQFFPNYYTIVPAAILVGIGAAPLWASYSVYLTQLSKLYNKNLSVLKPESTLPLFFGVFFLFHQMAQVFGNLISSTVLSAGEKNITGLLTSDYEHCGAAYCPVEHQSAIQTPSINFSENATREFDFMFSIYLVCSLLAVALNAFFLDTIESLSSYELNSKKKKSPTQLIIATFQHIKDNTLQMLLIPISICPGLKYAFFTAEFTVAYVTCGFGVQQIGYVMIWYGVNNAWFSLFLGVLSQKVSRFTAMSFAIAMDLGLMGFLLLWKPDPSHSYWLIIFTSIWGLSDAIWHTQLHALYGIIFSDNSEAAFSNLSMWGSLGFIIIFLLGESCVYKSIFIVLSILLLGSSLYSAVEFLYKKNGTTS